MSCRLRLRLLVPSGDMRSDVDVADVDELPSLFNFSFLFFFFFCCCCCFLSELHLLFLFPVDVEVEVEVEEEEEEEEEEHNPPARPICPTMILNHRM